MAAEPEPSALALRSGVLVEPFDVLLARHGPRIYAFVRRLVGPETADDAAQEAWVAIYRALPSFRGEAKLTTWMLTIAARCCRRQRRPALRLAEEADTDSLPDSGTSPPQAALNRELAGVVREAIDHLPPGQREAVHLRCIEELSYDEIAGVLHIPIGTVRSRLHHGTARLATLLAPYLEDRS
ncbi:MAG: sigma-70 family RNA polymerase sigma factor [Armatimonadetes bacterium]|nr:sigma-70 family RNA polymerase sigma factor [Armatimonadota bacterium]